MATQSVRDGAAAPNARKADLSVEVERLREYALSLLDEVEAQNGRAFAVALGGEAYTHDPDGNKINEKRMFEAIGNILAEAEAQNALRRSINDLAAAAAGEVRHG